MKVEYEEGKEIAMTHFCGEIGCERELVLTWKDGSHDLHCTWHPESTAFAEKLSYRQALHRGIPIPLKIESTIKAKENGMRDAGEIRTLIPTHDMGTNSLITAVRRNRHRQTLCPINRPQFMLSPLGKITLGQGD